ncbi:MAG: HD domain-containing protein [Eubacteriales bacterium]|nr:HD domain-containing protein [Eubacteriales bacterium]
MTIAELMEKLIAYTAEDSNVIHHDVNHFMKVWGFARTIGMEEGLDEKTQFTLEAAAILHDIACPLCRRKYGNTEGKHQEEEGLILAEKFLAETDIPEDIQARVVYLVSHHHTYTNVDGMDYQILLEADYLVNADESDYSKENIQNTGDKIFKTDSGLRLLTALYGYEK